MERHGRHLIQLKKRQGDIQLLQLGKLDLEEKTVGVERKSENGKWNELLRRDLNDVKIRIRNLNRNIRRDVNEKVRLTEDDLSRQNILDSEEGHVAVQYIDPLDDSKGAPDFHIKPKD